MFSLLEWDSIAPLYEAHHFVRERQESKAMRERGQNATAIGLEDGEREHEPRNRWFLEDRKGNTKQGPFLPFPEGIYSWLTIWD